MNNVSKIFIIWVINELEGGARLTNDPDDSGGLTKYGLAQRYNPTLDIRNLTIDDAINVYTEKYVTNACRKIPSERLRNLYFDATVNMGRSGAAVTLQRTLNVFRRKHFAAFGKPLLIDGRPGPKTLKALNYVLNVEHVFDVLIEFQHQRLLRYSRIVKRKPRLVKFLPGWINRVYKLSKRVIFSDR